MYIYIYIYIYIKTVNFTNRPVAPASYWAVSIIVKNGLDQGFEDRQNCMVWREDFGIVALLQRRLWTTCLSPLNVNICIKVC